MKKIIITVLGNDKPGILAAVSAIIFKHDCNIENISQTILQNEFAGIFVVSIPDNMSENDLKDAINSEISSSGLLAHVKILKETEDSEKPVESDPFVITTFGPDKKGLVAAITAVIAEFKTNIVNLRAVFKGGDDPHNNFMLYEISIPKDTDLSKMSASLKQTAEELGLVINIQHKNIFEAINKI